MDVKLWNALDALGDYDKVLAESIWVMGQIEEDDDCDDQTLLMGYNLIIAILIDKCDPHIPEEGITQQDVIRSAPGVNEVFASIGSPMSLMHHAVIGYAIALSQSRWGWRPWERVRDALLAPQEDATDQN